MFLCKSISQYSFAVNLNLKYAVYIYIIENKTLKLLKILMSLWSRTDLKKIKYYYLCYITYNVCIHLKIKIQKADAPILLD